MEALTDRQTALLAFLRSYQREHGLSPSIPDICRHFGYASPRAAAKLLEKLVEKAAIAREHGARRAIRLLGAAGQDPRHRLPLLGRIAAGAPLTAGEHIAEFIDINPALFARRPDLLFRVNGWSMKNAGIHDGDLVGVAEQAEVRNGQIVAAVIIAPKTDDPELTLKTYRQKGSIVTLHSENDDQERYPPMVFDTREQAVTVVGLYAGLIRTGVQK